MRDFKALTNGIPVTSLAAERDTANHSIEVVGTVAPITRAGAAILATILAGGTIVLVLAFHETVAWYSRGDSRLDRSTFLLCGVLFVGWIVTMATLAFARKDSP